MFGWILFRCFRKSCSSLFPCGHTTNMSSTYLYQLAGFFIGRLRLAVQNAACGG
jgi:hypothetical protein